MKLTISSRVVLSFFFFFQAEDGIRGLVRSRGLGDVCKRQLVPASSPIAQRGHLFYNTLYDENASCHIAIGRAYRFTLTGGEELTDEEFISAGGNVSLNHVDFMIGSPTMDIDGVKQDGSREPVMRQGEWAFEA